MNIKILGAGCARCHALDKLVREIVKEQNIDAAVEYIQDMGKILEYPVLATPGLVINEKVVASGRVPGKDEIIKMLKAAQSEEK